MIMYITFCHHFFSPKYFSLFYNIYVIQYTGKTGSSILIFRDLKGYKVQYIFYDTRSSISGCLVIYKKIINNTTKLPLFCNIVIYDETLLPEKMHVAQKFGSKSVANVNLFFLNWSTQGTNQGMYSFA